ncbi:MAG: SAM-dependent chlorinase/fluorinase [Cytophagaceae bacterium]|jgi:hypothetical protein|nr:SAM-dependent chlorinase/fluorinase [Cytophagaceae bacterium]
MALITFTSDFGLRDHYVAAVKAKILSVSVNLKIVDITHEIEPHNLFHAAYVIRSVFKDFPKGTVHLVSVNTSTHLQDKLLAMKLEDHYFVGSDNGLFSLISAQKPMAIVELKKDINNQNFDPSFPEKTTMAVAASMLANGANIYNLGPQYTPEINMNQRLLRTSKNQLSGVVMHVDNFGNLITNIHKDAFVQSKLERAYSIHFSREQLDEVSQHYHEVDPGECLALFNSNGFLEIAIREGNASQLLGMEFESPVHITFLDAR